MSRSREAKRRRDQDYKSRKRQARAVGDEALTLDALYARDGWRCALCGGWVERADASIDHIIPLAGGGTHTRENVRLAHRRCNSNRQH